MKKALLIVDHGSVKEEANNMLYEVAKILQRLEPDLIVNIAHMELAHPTIEEGIENCVSAGATEIVVHPYMLSPGRHATKDVPRMVKEYSIIFPGIKIRVTEPLGLHENIAKVVLERAGLMCQ